jgi:hypothetical protein
MTDHIQPGPPSQPQCDPAVADEANEPFVSELRRRVQALEREKGRWKVIGITALFALVVVACGGGIVGVGTASFSAYRYKQVEAELEARRAEMEAQIAQEAMEHAKREAAEKQAK